MLLEEELLSCSAEFDVVVAVCCGSRLFILNDREAGLDDEEELEWCVDADLDELLDVVEDDEFSSLLFKTGALSVAVVVDSSDLSFLVFDLFFDLDFVLLLVLFNDESPLELISDSFLRLLLLLLNCTSFESVLFC